MGLCFVSVMFNVSTYWHGRLCQLLSVARVQVDKKHTWYTVSACVKFYRSYLFSIDESGPSAAVGEAQLSRFIKGFTASLQATMGLYWFLQKMNKLANLLPNMDQFNQHKLFLVTLRDKFQVMLFISES